LNWQAAGESFVTLFVIMDPLGNIPYFVALTKGTEPARRRVQAIQAALAAGGLVVGFALFGRLILDYLHISIESLSIAGGLLLLLVALQSFRGESLPAEEATNVALVPLATPLLAGPGAIAAVMLLAGRYSDSAGRLGLIAGIGGVILTVAVVLILAAQVSRLLRPAAINFLGRVLALLLSAIAVQLIVNAIHSLAV
jgi:multiple antibiotic resistance protein